MLQHRILEHLENAQGEDATVIGATWEDFLASLERVITVHDVKLGKARLEPVCGDEGAQLMGRGSVDAEDLHAILKR
jgi:hypothetical protein